MTKKNDAQAEQVRKTRARYDTIEKAGNFLRKYGPVVLGVVVGIFTLGKFMPKK